MSDSDFSEATSPCPITESSSRGAASSASGEIPSIVTSRMLVLASSSPDGGGVP